MSQRELPVHFLQRVLPLRDEVKKMNAQKSIDGTPHKNLSWGLENKFFAKIFEEYPEMVSHFCEKLYNSPKKPTVFHRLKAAA